MASKNNKDIIIFEGEQNESTDSLIEKFEKRYKEQDSPFNIDEIIKEEYFEKYNIYKEAKKVFLEFNFFFMGSYPKLEAKRRAKKISDTLDKFKFNEKIDVDYIRNIIFLLFAEVFLNEHSWVKSEAIDRLKKIREEKKNFVDVHELRLKKINNLLSTSNPKSNIPCINEYFDKSSRIIESHLIVIKEEINRYFDATTQKIQHEIDEYGYDKGEPDSLNNRCVKKLVHLYSFVKEASKMSYTRLSKLFAELGLYFGIYSKSEIEMKKAKIKEEYYGLSKGHYKKYMNIDVDDEIEKEIISSLALNIRKNIKDYYNKGEIKSYL